MPFGRFFPNSPKREPNPAAKIITFNHVLLINRVYDFFELIFGYKKQIRFEKKFLNIVFLIKS